MLKEKLITCFVLAIIIFFPIASTSSLADGCVTFRTYGGPGNTNYNGCTVSDTGSTSCNLANPSIAVDNGQLYGIGIFNFKKRASNLKDVLSNLPISIKIEST